LGESVKDRDGVRRIGIAVELVARMARLEPMEMVIPRTGVPFTDLERLGNP